MTKCDSDMMLLHLRIAEYKTSDLDEILTFDKHIRVALPSFLYFLAFERF
jgi:hypothetical protein